MMVTSEDDAHDKRLTDEHARNLGWILLRLAEHTPGDFGDSSFNSTLVSYIDLGRPAEDLVEAMCSMPPEKAEECVNCVNTGIPDMRARNRRGRSGSDGDELPH